MPRFLISLLFVLNGAVLLTAVLAGDFFLSPGIKAVLNARKEIAVSSADSLLQLSLSRETQEVTISV